jgi:hypothetical protein
VKLKPILAREIQDAHECFLAIVGAVPESEYALPTDNPAWTVGDTLYHVTLGPGAIAFEVWMIVHARGLFQFWLDHFPHRLFNRLNARFAQRGSQINRQALIKAYEAGHAVIRSRLRRTREEDLQKWVTYPAELAPEISGKVTVERLFRYTKGHVEMHEKQLRIAPAEANTSQ